MRYLTVALLLLSACAMERHREQIRQGFLVRGLRREAFLDVWGTPTRTGTATGEEITSAGITWGGFANRSGSVARGDGFFRRGRERFDVWEYADLGVTLFFSGRVLEAWETNRTVDQLCTVPRF